MLVHAEKLILHAYSSLTSQIIIKLSWRVSYFHLFSGTGIPFILSQSITTGPHSFKTIWMLITIHAFGPVKELHLPLPAIKILNNLVKWLKDFTKLLKTFSPADLLLSLKTPAKTFLDYIYPSSYHARTEEIFIKRDSFGRRFWHLLLFWWFRCFIQTSMNRLQMFL